MEIELEQVMVRMKEIQDYVMYHHEHLRGARDRKRTDINSVNSYTMVSHPDVEVLGVYVRAFLYRECLAWSSPAENVHFHNSPIHFAVVVFIKTVIRFQPLRGATDIVLNHVKVTVPLCIGDRSPLR